MIDEHDLFLRAAERFDPPQDSYERLVAREARRVRRQRVGAAVVAIVLVAAAFGGVLLAIRSATQVEPVAPPTGTGIFAPVSGWIAVYDQPTHRVRAVDPTGVAPPIDLPGQAEPLAWSSDGTHLLLADGSVVNPDGSIIQVLSRRAASTGSFSPDGTGVLFAGKRGLYVANTDGSGQPRLLVRDPRGGYYLLSPVWSPDGSSIAYATAGNGEDIWVMKSDGTDRRRLVSFTHQQAQEMSQLAWSPDGTSIAFAIDPYADNRNPSSIGVVRADGSGSRMLTHRDGGWNPVWSPDGSQIAFTRNNGRVYTMSTDGSDVRRIPGATTFLWRTAWNPLPPG